jgi:glycosyltransferase involved in cell wall biosynthesis
MALASWVKHSVRRDFLPRSWLPTDGRVTLRVIPRISARWVGRNDVVVANGWRTMAPVAALSPDCGRRIVYVQHMETWDASPQELDAAWQLPLHHVATSDWLVEESRKRGRTADKVPVGIDHDLFFVEVPPERRLRPIVALLGHDLDWKGTAVALAAFELARREVPELVAEVFCSRPPRWPTPQGVRLSIDPDAGRLRGLYNSAQVFLAPSFSEGWDLPACEATPAAPPWWRAPSRCARSTPRTAKRAPRQPRPTGGLAAALVKLLGDAPLRLRRTRRPATVSVQLGRAPYGLFDSVLQSLTGSAPVTTRQAGHPRVGATADGKSGDPARV